jgi:hypothetical protein
MPVLTFARSGACRVRHNGAGVAGLGSALREARFQVDLKFVANQSAGSAGPF